MTILSLTELTEADLLNLHSARSINIVLGKWLESDIDLFFGPLLIADITLKVSENVTWDKVLVVCGFFKSRRDAKGSGWGISIPKGFSMHNIGKFHREIAALNMQE